MIWHDYSFDRESMFKLIVSFRVEIGIGVINIQLFPN